MRKKLLVILMSASFILTDGSITALAAEASIPMEETTENCVSEEQEAISAQEQEMLSDEASSVETSKAEIDTQSEMQTGAQMEVQAEAQTEAQTETQTEVQTETQTEVQTEAQTEAETQTETQTITGFEDGDFEERVFYVDRYYKPSLEEVLEELPTELDVYLDGADEVTAIDVTYECVGEDYDSSEGYYFQFSPVWDETQYVLSDDLEYLVDAPYYALIFYDGDGISVASTATSSNAKTVYNFLTGTMGLNSAAACGIMANIQYESGFSPTATGDNGTSYGICQWHNTRYTALKTWCSNHGYNYTTLTGQLYYLQYELSQNNSNYLWNGKTIKNHMSSVSNSASGAYDAGYYWCYNFEIPANKSSVSVTRGNLAKNTYWPIYGKTTTAITVKAVSGAEIGGRATDALRLNWNRNSAADGYIIYQYKNGSWTRIARIGTNSTTTYRVSGLSAGTTYSFLVQCFAFSGSTPYYSSGVCVKGTTIPSSVSGLKIGGRAGDALRLNWTKNSAASGYIIEQYKNGSWARIARIASNSTVTYRVEGLSAYTTYKFRICAFDFDGSTPLYSSYQTISGKTLPSSVSGLKIGGWAKDALRLNWTKNSHADGYIIEQKKNGSWVRIARIASNSTVTYRVGNLSSKTTYQFRICSFGFDGSTPLYSGYTYVNGTTY